MGSPKFVEFSLSLHLNSTLEKIQINTIDVRNILRNLDPGKASWPDEIPKSVLKECAAELAGPLSRLFQLLFSCGVFPQQWKTAREIPIHIKETQNQI